MARHDGRMTHLALATVNCISFLDPKMHPSSSAEHIYSPLLLALLVPIQLTKLKLTDRLSQLPDQPWQISSRHGNFAQHFHTKTDHVYENVSIVPTIHA
jgi:hypothetical protein